MGPTPTSEEGLIGLAGDSYDLSFGVNKSRRYHEKLCSFYCTWRDWMKIVTAVAGSGAFLLVTSKTETLALFVTAFIALWAVIDIIVSPDRKAELHKSICEQFTSLAEKIAASPATEDAYKTNLAERLRIEKAEPPVKRLVDLQARNDECRSRGFPASSMVPLSETQRLLGYFFTFGLSRLERWQAKGGD